MKYLRGALLLLGWLLSYGMSWGQDKVIYLNDLAFVFGSGEARTYLRQDMQAFYEQHHVRLAFTLLPESSPSYQVNARQDESLLLEQPSACLSITTWHDERNYHYRRHEVQINEALAQRLPQATAKQIVNEWLSYYHSLPPESSMQMGLELVMIKLGDYLSALPPPEVVPTITFANAKATGAHPPLGLDAFTDQVHHSHYQHTEVNKAPYPVAWKALLSGQPTSVLAQVADSLSFPPGLIFKQNGNNIASQPTSRNHQQQLMLTGQMHEQEGYVDVYASREEDAELVGKLNTISYDALYQKLVLIVLDGVMEDPPYLAKLSREVQAIFAQAGVSLTVESQEFDTEWADRDVPLQDETSGLLSNYPDELKRVIKDYCKEHEEEKQTAYIFLAGSSSTGKLGYMPKKRPYGFVYLHEHEHGEPVAKTIAHELGHGLFRLEHTFEAYPALSKGSTANLMDYGKGTRLQKYQWDLVHNPQAMLGWFQDEEENADMTFRQDVEWIVELYSPWYSNQFIAAFDAKNKADMKKWIDKGLTTPFSQEQVGALGAIDELLPRKKDGSVPVAILKHYPNAKIKGLYVYYTQKDGAVIKAADRPRAFTEDFPVDTTLYTAEFDNAVTTLEDKQVTEAFANLAYDFVWETVSEQSWTDQAVNWMKEAWAYPNVGRDDQQVSKIMTSIAKTSITESHTHTLKEQIVYTYAFDAKTSKIPLALYAIEENPTFKRKDLVDLEAGEDKPFALLGFCEGADANKPQLLIQVGKEHTQLLKDYFAAKGQLEQVQATFAAKATLTAAEIGEVRELIKLVEDEEKRKELYRELQKKVPYHNQRDNINDDADYMCNLTSQAMCFEYLGITNPDPSMQFEDYLEKIRTEGKFGDRTISEVRDSIASHLGIRQGLKWDPTMTKVYLQKLFNTLLDKDCSIMISCGGHLVRLQGLSDNGLIVDDPYGKVDLINRYKTNKNSYGDNANTKSGSTIKGEDNIWKWSDVIKVEFKYVEWYYKD